MDLYLVVKRPGQLAELLPAPPRIELEFAQSLVGGYIEVLPTKALVSQILRDVTMLVNEEGKPRGLPENLKLEFDVIRGPVVITLTNDEGDDHGLCLEHAEAVAKALDHYGVGLPQKVN